MNTAVINIKINPTLKKQARNIAEELGINLSSLIKGYLKQLVRTKAVSFSLEEQPTDYLLKALKESREDIRAGRLSPTFESPNDAIKWLHNKNKKYEG
jgi:addiction module RelB/DinJ family antitoxin